MINFLKTLLRTNGFARFFRELFLGFSDSRITATSRFTQLCASHQIEFIADVGANVGQFSKDVRRHGFKNHIVSFEPASHSFQSLKKNFVNDSNWQGMQLGVGSKPDKLTINISANSGLSTSFLGMDSSHLENFPNSAYIASEEVDVITLDGFFESQDFNPGKIAVKIDVQGYELEVLRGMRRYLPEIKLLMMEISLVSLYLGEPKMIEVLSFLESHNHKIVDIFRGVKSKSGDLLQIDLITESREK